MGGQQSVPEPEPEPEMFTTENLKMVAATIAAVTLVARFPTLKKNVAKMSAEDKSYCMLSCVGIVASIVAMMMPPAETYFSIGSALKVAYFVYGGFYVLFLFMTDFFFADNFKVAPKDNFGRVFAKMFGALGLWGMWLMQALKPAELFTYFAIYNACIIYVGPQRGQMLLPTNEKHIVPHILLTVVGLSLAAAVP